jgi:hypothetical protein
MNLIGGLIVVILFGVLIGLLINHLGGGDR